MFFKHILFLILIFFLLSSILICLNLEEGGEEESSPHLPIYISLRSIIILSSDPQIGLNVSFLQVLQLKFCLNFSYLPSVLQFPAIYSLTLTM
jgi:hypothetical protein